jgi:tRNA pseudouridine55 synthase
MTNDKKITVSGFLNINKPLGWTSHDCVGKVRRLLGLKKVGHGGTLDPLATGVLPMAVGHVTRLLQFLPEKKAYIAKIRFGIRTNTDDLEGEVLESNISSSLTLSDVKIHLPSFLGEIEQIPPAFSAIKKDGSPLYKLARKGEQVDVPKRIVNIEKIEVLNWFEGDFPELELKIICGGGTYIRAIARDLGSLVKVGGTLASLERTLSCGMEINESLTFEQIESNLSQYNLDLIPPEKVLNHLKVINLNEDEGRRWCQGQKIVIDDPADFPFSTPLRVKNDQGILLGIGELYFEENQTLLKVKVVLSPLN